MDPTDDRPTDDRKAVERLRRAGLPDSPVETWTRDEIETLVTGFPPTAPASVHALNTAIGVSDTIGRIVTAACLGLAILVVLAVGVTPWLWIAVAAWVACIVATIVVMFGRRRSVPSPMALDAPRR